jgi:16S rRNA processing protein RimM
VREAKPSSGLEIARVVAVHGLRGLVKVVPHWSGSTALSNAEELVLALPSGERRRYRVESCTPAPKALLVKLAGVDTREASEALRGARVEIERDAVSGAGDAPFLVDLVGASVEGPDGPLGRVVEILVNPSVDSVIVERPNGERVEVMLRSEHISAIDRERIVLASNDAILE